MRKKLTVLPDLFNLNNLHNLNNLNNLNKLTVLPDLFRVIVTPASCCFGLRPPPTLRGNENCKPFLSPHKVGGPS